MMRFIPCLTSFFVQIWRDCVSHLPCSVDRIISSIFTNQETKMIPIPPLLSKIYARQSTNCPLRGWGGLTEDNDADAMMQITRFSIENIQTNKQVNYRIGIIKQLVYLFVLLYKVWIYCCSAWSHSKMQFITRCGRRAGEPSQNCKVKAVLN